MTLANLEEVERRVKRVYLACQASRATLAFLDHQDPLGLQAKRVSLVLEDLDQKVKRVNMALLDPVGLMACLAERVTLVCQD